MDIIIAHPNGWGTREQAFLRRAAATSGFAKETVDTQIRFVTEAEASSGINFAVCDAGGSTVDTTLYTVEKDSPKLQLSEKCVSACVQSGAIFIDKRAESYLRHHFESAGLSDERVDEYVTTGLQEFKVKEKLRFNGTTELRIKVTSARTRDERAGIRSGTLKLPRRA
ncbi:unnamed protein product [Rhizoctonia solani]|uniref:Uncharacterized protein n=1 Tax=Rhizoctonia solani TaxID=456999 RepID=A0A8H3BE62_9AGAM|nr:unnamed protein product [Rhizoctonia solani]